MSRLQQEGLQDTALSMADLIAERLESPEAVRGRAPQRQWWPQSLAHGAAGVALKRPGSGGGSDVPRVEWSRIAGLHAGWRVG